MEKPARRGPYRNGIETKSQLVQAALRQFAEHGYTGASLRKIAGEVGVSPATLLQHFGSKEGLLAAVLLEWTLQSPMLRDEPGELLPRLRQLMADNLTNRGLLELFLSIAAEASNAAHPAHSFIRQRYEAIIEILHGYLAREQANGSIRLMAADEADSELRILVAVMDGLGLQWLIDPDFDLVGAFDLYLEVTSARWLAPERKSRRPEQPDVKVRGSIKLTV